MDNPRDIILTALQDSSLLEVEIEHLADKLEAALKEVFADAEKWRKVKEIASPRHLIACADCPVTKQCRNGAEGLCSSVYKLVAALSEAPHGN